VRHPSRPGRGRAEASASPACWPNRRGSGLLTAGHTICRERAYLGSGPTDTDHLVLRQLSSSAISAVGALLARAPPSTQASPRSIHASLYTGWQPLRRSTLDPKSSEESSAPGRGLMPGGAGSCPVAAAVRAAAPVPSPRSRRGWPSAPGAVTRARSGRPAGGRRPRGCSDAGQAGRCLSASSGPPWDVRPTGRADVQRSGVRCPGVRGLQVSGRTGLWCPRRCRRPVRAALDLEWLGVAGRPGRAQRVHVPRAPWSAGGVVACLHRA
jgi:hypothetical protein